MAHRYGFDNHQFYHCPSKKMLPLREAFFFHLTYLEWQIVRTLINSRGCR